MDGSLNRRDFLAATSAGLASVALERIATAGPTSQGKRLTLLHFADTHAHLETHPEFMPGETPNFRMMGGFARLKTAIERERATARGPSFLFDGGDEFQGSAPAAWSEGEVILRPLNALGADVFVPGNWEPVYGPERFHNLMRRLTAQVASFNFHSTETGERLFEPAIVIERDGVRVAVVGITDIFASGRQPPSQFHGMDTSRMEGLRQFVQELKAKQKPDLVVAVTHTGLTTSRKLARDVPEFDVVLSGHTHERTQQAILEGKTIVAEPGSMGSFLGRLDLVLKPEGGVAEYAFRLIPIEADEFEEDPGVKSLVDAELKPYRERMQEVVGFTQTPIFRYDVLETSADDFITDAVREAAGADIALSNGFRFGAPIMPGEITTGDLWSLLPMDARMKRGWITGKELKQY
ncbi:MAG TPA: bifunctional metallophosphatase/5'-nucleotidase, partial [Pirellulales bacterium]|nr:bifunctional metallophosphatase/5'-nucleotidase [Pirellulales bacterium]